MFRMPLFFFLAGFFGSRYLRRNGAGNFVRNRVRRVLAPLVAGWFVIYPFLMASWIRGLQHSGSPDLPDAIRNLPAGKLAIGMFLTGRAFGDQFSLGHLWFLYYLVLLSAAAATLQRIPRLDHAAESLMKVLPRRGGLLPLTLPIALAVWASPGWNGLTLEESTLWPDIRPLLAYGCYFTFGWLLGTREQHMSDLCRRWRAHLVMATFFTAVLFSAYAKLSSAPQTSELMSGWRRALFCLSYAFLSWRWILALAGFFTARCASANVVVTYLSGASYTVYLVHLPIVVALQVRVAEWPVPPLLKYVVIVLATLFASLVVYELLVRRTPIRQYIGIPETRSGKQLQGSAATA